MTRTPDHRRANRTRTARRAGACALVALSALALAAGCSSKKKHTAASSPSSSTSSSAPSPTPTPTATKKAAAPAINPLTGGRFVAGPVIAAKIDDTENGRPQRNIDQADIVYVEQAEGGLTRLVAVFDTHKPVVGYVRSVRTSDPELLAQYGRVTLAASGGGGDSLPTLDASTIRGWIMDRGAAGYSRSPHDNDHGYVNVTLDLAAVSKLVKTGTAQNMGFTWSSARTGLTTAKAANVIRTVVGSTPVEFHYNARTGRYERYIDGVRQVAADGNVVSTPNVIVQYCTVSVHPGDVDVNGNPAQYTHSVGRGPVVVFRNGRIVTGTWLRTASKNGTVLRDAAKRAIPLQPGGAWVVLATRGAPLTTG